ncbi:MAG: hypothetical protein BWY57_00598 [Betaproteobacteria bacterium ADurb.Bin341]|nr:MAG: hypothetical protein BWY57_00598 [Betaproteobacteria bacterium ADurb.Bin341]
MVIERGLAHRLLETLATEANLKNGRSPIFTTLDAAVAAAYGWNDYTPEMVDEEILRRLLALNLERASA